MLTRVIFFLVTNFAALALGGLSTNAAVKGDWYLQLHKAPWTPPGWVFGFAWTSIMITFACYMAFLWQAENKRTTRSLYLVQWLLNVGWNPIFFSFHQTYWALTVIVLLTLLISYLFFFYGKELGWKRVFIAPYWLWLLIATSLNGYVCVFN